MPRMDRAGWGRRDMVWLSARGTCRANKTMHSLTEAVTKIKIVLIENKCVRQNKFEMQSWILIAEKIQLSLCATGFSDEDWKRWETDVQRICSGEVLQARVWMEINALTKHLLPANTSEICASEVLSHVPGDISQLQHLLKGQKSVGQSKRCNLWR